MKRFYMVLPFREDNKIKSLRYETYDNSLFLMDRDIMFPVTALIHAYVKPEDEYELVLIKTGENNFYFEKLQEETEALAKEKGLKKPAFKIIQIGFSLSSAEQISLFRRLVETSEHGDEMFFCITFGSKPSAITLLLFCGYAAKMEHADIGGIIYGSYVRETGQAVLYDYTALFLMESILGERPSAVKGAFGILFSEGELDE